MTEQTITPRGPLVLRTLAMPRDTNPRGDIFGGWILSQMDVAGGLMAAEVARGRTVTVSVNDVVFHEPIRVGDTICVHAEVMRIGRTSIDVRLEVWARGVLHDFELERDLMAEGVFRFVAVDEQGRPRPVPQDSIAEFIGPACPSTVATVNPR